MTKGGQRDAVDPRRTGKLKLREKRKFLARRGALIVKAPLPLFSKVNTILLTRWDWWPEDPKVGALMLPEDHNCLWSCQHIMLKTLPFLAPNHFSAKIRILTQLARPWAEVRKELFQCR